MTGPALRTPFQYILLKIASRRKGRPELWYLPESGFRLVVRNLPYRKTLTDIRYRAFVRRIMPSSPGASVATCTTSPSCPATKWSYSPVPDQILLSFTLGTRSWATVPGIVTLRITSKPGAVQTTTDLMPDNRLICDYTATIHNFLNLDILTGKRAEITATSLSAWHAALLQHDGECEFPVDRTRNIH